MNDGRTLPVPKPLHFQRKGLFQRRLLSFKKSSVVDGLGNVQTGIWREKCRKRRRRERKKMRTNIKAGRRECYNYPFLLPGPVQKEVTIMFVFVSCQSQLSPHLISFLRFWVERGREAVKTRQNFAVCEEKERRANGGYRTREHSSSMVIFGYFDQNSTEEIQEHIAVTLTGMSN